MRKLKSLTIVALIALAPAMALAQEKMEKHPMQMVTNGAKKAADATVDLVKEHPGKSTGVVACGVAVVFFPPALLVCGGALVAGTGVDVVAVPDKE